MKNRKLLLCRVLKIQGDRFDSAKFDHSRRSIRIDLEMSFHQNLNSGFFKILFSEKNVLPNPDLELVVGDQAIFLRLIRNLALLFETNVLIRSVSYQVRALFRTISELKYIFNIDTTFLRNELTVVVSDINCLIFVQNIIWSIPW